MKTAKFLISYKHKTPAGGSEEIKDFEINKNMLDHIINQVATGDMEITGLKKFDKPTLQNKTKK